MVCLRSCPLFSSSSGPPNWASFSALTAKPLQSLIFFFQFDEIQFWELRFLWVKFLSLCPKISTSAYKHHKGRKDVKFSSGTCKWHTDCFGKFSLENLGWRIIPICKLNGVRCYFLCTICIKQLKKAQQKEQEANSTSSKLPCSHSLVSPI